MKLNLVLQITLLTAGTFGFPFCSEGQINPPARPAAASKSRTSADPAKFIALWEQTHKDSSIRYDPGNAELRLRIIKVDSASTLVVKILPELIDKDTALNQLLISAQLTSGDKTTDVPVSGYSEIGKDQTTGDSQNAVSIQTVAQIGALMENFYWTARDILDQGFSPECRQALETKPNDTPLPGMGGPCKEDDATIADTTSKLFVVYRSSEAKAIPAFFADPHNQAVVKLLSSQIFGMDAASLTAVAGDFTQALTTLYGTSSTVPAKHDAARSLLARVWLAYRDIRLDYSEYLREPCKPEGGDVASIHNYAVCRTRELVDILKKNLASGQIDLATAGAKDGDRLTITIESKGIDANGTSAVLKLNLLIRNYGYRTAVSPSLLFIRRISVTEADKADRQLNPVRFAPTPGVTYGVTFLSRSGLMSALAPGLGANVTFMNFNDPTDFNISTGKFTNSTAVNVQFGAGVVVSLFNNMVQATYGWNLNAPQKRTYWGLGFGFLDVAKYFANKFGK